MTPKVLARKFTSVNDFVLISPAPEAANASSGRSQTPDAVLIFGWFDAQPAHLHKYTEGYHALYPTATQILVRSNLAIMWALVYGRRYLAAILRPVVEVLKECGITSLHDQSSRVLMHAFSNGGCFQLTMVLKLLSELSPPPSVVLPLPSSESSSPDKFPNQPVIRNHLPADPTATARSESGGPGPVFVFDSAPGHVSFIMLARSFTAGIKSPILRALLYIPAGLTVFLFKAVGLRRWLLPFGSRGKEPFLQMRGDLLNPTLIPLTAPRLYFYSMSDPLVSGETVEQHIEEARQVGVTTILTKRDDRAAHVNHLGVDPIGYWAAVRKLWAIQ